MKRRNVAILPVLSLVLGITAVWLWARTVYLHSDGVEYGTITTAGLNRGFDLCTFDGSVFLGWIDIVPLENSAGKRDYDRGFAFAFRDYGFSRGFLYSAVTSQYGHGWGTVGWGCFACAAYTLPTAKDQLKAIHAIGVPFWFLIILCGIVPGRRLYLILRSRRRLAQHLCLHCGYDLRASNGRCPECGTPMSLEPADGHKGPRRLAFVSLVCGVTLVAGGASLFAYAMWASWDTVIHPDNWPQPGMDTMESLATWAVAPMVIGVLLLLLALPRGRVG